MRVPLKIGENNLAIPYWPIDHGDSVNYGYMDLKANPHLIADVPEAKNWPEMIALLEAINSPASACHSLGCEKSFSSWSRTEEPHLNTKRVSYIDMAFDHIGLNADATLFDEMMGACAVFAQHRQFDRFVRFDSELTRTNYTRHNLNAWCLSIWLGGFGETETQARAAWATVVSVLNDFFSSDWAPNSTVNTDAAQ